jgi:hypothetical protein
MNKSFTMDGKKMVYDRGRYKEAGNVGSKSEKKSSWIRQLFGAKKVLAKEAPVGIGAAIGTRAKMIQEIDEEIAKQYK